MQFWGRIPKILGQNWKLLKIKKNRRIEQNIFTITLLEIFKGVRVWKQTSNASPKILRAASQVLL
jgi:hypothetical protein